MPSEGRLDDVIQAPLIAEEGFAKFLLDVKEKIEEIDHTLKGEIKVIEEGKEAKWEKHHDEIMKDDARRKYISTMHEFCNRIFTMSYYPEYNDIMRIVREVRINIGDLLAKEYYSGNIICGIEYLRVIRDTSARMIESCLMWALEGGMRRSIRETTRTTEVIRPGKAQEEGKKFFKLF